MAKNRDFYAKHLARAANSFFYPLKPAHYLELVTPLWNYAHLQARIEGVVKETPDTTTLLLRPGKGWRIHQAGQFVRLGVSIDGKRHVRTYSLSSPPERHDGLITITVKAVSDGRVSQYLTHHVRPGFYLSLSQPEGAFLKPASDIQKVLFLTAGSGITPVMSMLRSMVLTRSTQDIVHIHYAKNKDDVIFGAELRQLADSLPGYQLTSVFTRDRFDTSLPDSKLSQKNISRLCPDWISRKAFSCGPAVLLDEAERIWTKSGQRDRLSLERFHAKRASLPTHPTGGHVRFIASHFEAPADGVTPLLKIAEGAGLNPPHGCRMGICHGCDALLKAGKVRDLRTGEITSCHDGVKIQLCVSAAASDVDLDL